MQWFYADGDTQMGPVAEPEFEALVQTGKISAETRVWRDGMEDWVRYGDVPVNGERAAQAVAAEPAVETHRCAECGTVYPSTEMIAFEHVWVCGRCKPRFVQKLREGIVPAAPMNYAGFWIRVCAYMIDGVIRFIIAFCLQIIIVAAMAAGGAARVAGGFASLTQLFIGIGYETFFNGHFGATPGKMALRLKIVRSDGRPISYALAFGRYFAKIINLFTLFIGYMMVGWDSQKRGLHDMICDTRVIHQ